MLYEVHFYLLSVAEIVALGLHLYLQYAFKLYVFLLIFHLYIFLLFICSSLASYFVLLSSKEKSKFILFGFLSVFP